MRTYQIIILLLSLTHIFPAIAENKVNQEFVLCKPFPQIAPPRPKLPPLKSGFVRLYADDVLIQEKLGTSTAHGNVFVQRADQVLNTPIVTYNRNQNVVNADKDFTLWDKDFIVSGSKIQLRPKNQGEMTNAEYWLLNRRVRGLASKIIRESKDIMNLEQASYTTCDPDQEVWRLDASHLRLDNAKSEGIARDVTIRFLSIPVFYFPYISFPIGDERKSGILVPSIGRTDETGMEFSLPYYFNLAPHYDATLTPRLMSRRGLLLETEFRYLTQATDGNLEFEYLPYDQVFEEDRGSLVFKHNGALTKRLNTDININYVSDNRYFEELGSNISVTSITHLERRADLRYSGRGWDLTGRLHQFQTLDKNPNARPYQRLPQLLFKTNLPEKNRQIHLKLQGEWVRFDRDIDVVDAPIGNRWDMKSIFSFPWRTPGTFVIPKLSLRYTGYHLDNVATNDNTAPDRLLFTASTDSGLFFERDINWRSTALVQTLEPRVFYRYTPYKDQNDIPIFDTAPYDFSFLQLFRDNRFIGADRVDDAHQVTLAMTSRLLGGYTGIEHLRASLGQTFYFRDRRVTLPSHPEETESSSLIVMELAAQAAKHWRASSTLRWDPHTDNTDHTVVRMRYNPDVKRIVNFSYRLRDQLLEQADTSFYLSLNQRWNILGRWNYSLLTEKTLESFVGLEYSSCCWAIRGIMRRYINNIEGDGYSNGFFIQFQLKGLGKIGQKTDSFLEQRIPGFYDQF